ncbi:MAG TPA: flagellar hook-associated protein FlgL [Bacillota bacterium]|nr:flagellar hook-associated protein FlgL [Bacillota bacterium]
MRITEKIVTNGVTRNINSSMRRIDKRYDEISTGKRIRYPSDDPVGLITSLRLNDQIKEAERYVTNSDSAISWLEASDAALTEMTKVLHRLEELAVASGNGHLAESSLNAYAEEVHELKGHVLQIANTQLGSRYLFAGQQTTQSAYTDAFAYQGDENPLSIEVGAGVSLDVSYSGTTIFGDANSAAGDFFEFMDAFEAHIRAGDIDAIAGDITGINDQLTRTLNNQASIGAKVNRLERSNERYSQLDVQFKKLLSKNEDVDLAEATMNLKMQESVYQAALAAGARVLQTSMLNYMR